MWSARLRRHVQSRRAKRRVTSAKPQRAPHRRLRAEDWIEVRLGGAAAQVAAPDPTLRAYWAKVGAGAWEPETFAHLARALDRAGASPVFVDVGAWIGPITLFAAARGARVLALEPDPAARTELLENIAANPALAERITVLPVALDPGAERLALYPHSKRFGASKTSSLPDPSGVAVGVETVDAAAVTAALRRFGPHTGAVLKADIEGHEFTAGGELAALIAALRADALISTHPRSVFDAARRAGDAEPHRAAHAAVRGLIAGFAAADLAARPLERPDADPQVFAAVQVFARGLRPRNFDLAVRPR